MASLNARKVALLKQYCGEIERLITGWTAMVLTNGEDEVIGVLIGEEEAFEDYEGK